MSNCTCIEQKKREKFGPSHGNEGIIGITYGPASKCNGCHINIPDDYKISEDEIRKRIDIHKVIISYSRQNGKSLSSDYQGKITKNGDKVYFLPSHFVDVMNNHSI